MSVKLDTTTTIPTPGRGDSAAATDAALAALSSGGVADDADPAPVEVPPEPAAAEPDNLAPAKLDTKSFDAREALAERFEAKKAADIEAAALDTPIVVPDAAAPAAAQPALAALDASVEVIVDGQKKNISVKEAVALAQQRMAEGNRLGALNTALDEVRALKQNFGEAKPGQTNAEPAAAAEPGMNAPAKADQPSDPARLLEVVRQIQSGDEQEAATALGAYLKETVGEGQGRERTMASVREAIAEQQAIDADTRALVDFGKAHQDILASEEKTDAMLGATARLIIEDLAALGLAPEHLAQARANPGVARQWHNHYQRQRNDSGAPLYNGLRSNTAILTEAGKRVRTAFGGGPVPAPAGLKPTASASPVRAERKAAIETSQPRTAEARGSARGRTDAGQATPMTQEEARRDGMNDRLKMSARR